MSRTHILTPVFAVLGALLVLFLTVPVVGMVARESPATLGAALTDAEVRAALWVSVGGAAIATALALCFGVPLAYLLARHSFPGKAVVQGLVDMPVVIPHLAAGIALLMVLGPAEALGLRFIDALPGTVAAMLFVSAPFVINAARAGFEAVDPRLEKASRSLGASPVQTFLGISLPLAAGPIVSGAVMTWARAVSEFGAVLVIAYAPRTGPVLLYERLTGFGLRAARPIAVLLVLISLIVFIALRLGIGRGRQQLRRGADAHARQHQ